MFVFSNLFVGERKELVKVKDKLLTVYPAKAGELNYSDILELPIPHFFVTESCEEIKPQKWMKLLTGFNVGYYWCAENETSEVFLRTECDETRDLLPCYYAEIVYRDGSVTKYPYLDNADMLVDTISKHLGILFKTIDQLRSHSDYMIEQIKVFEYKVCDRFGNSLSADDDIQLMYDYINVDDFIKWLNYKLRNDGVYEVSEKNVKPFLKDIEIQMHPTKGISSHFVLPGYSTRSGNYEAYKYTFRNINGKDTVCL